MDRSAKIQKFKTFQMLPERSWQYDGSEGLGRVDIEEGHSPKTPGPLDRVLVQLESLGTKAKPTMVALLGHRWSERKGIRSAMSA